MSSPSSSTTIDLHHAGSISTPQAPLRRPDPDREDSKPTVPRKKQEPQRDPVTRSNAPRSSTSARRTIRFKRGLDLPIAGLPEQTIEPGPKVTRVAVVGQDHVGMKPTMAVEEGDQVVTGQILFHDKKQTGVCYTSPGCGTVVAIHRGAKRALLSVVIELDGTASRTFTGYHANELDAIPREDVIRQLVQSGVWTALRERPFDRTPSPMVFGPIDLDGTAKVSGQDAAGIAPQDQVLQVASVCAGGASHSCSNSGSCSGGCSAAPKAMAHSQNMENQKEEGDSEANRVPLALFISAIDTRPLAADPEVVIGQRAGYFHDGLRVLDRLGIAKNYLCAAPGARIPGADLAHIKRVDFAGPHPAGLVGTHIHTLEPVSRNRRVWHINYQEVIAIGRLFRTGELDLDRVVSLAGPGVARPRLVRTRLGADLGELVEGQLIKEVSATTGRGSLGGGSLRRGPLSKDNLGKEEPLAVQAVSEKSHRIISGSVLAGRRAAGKDGVDRQTAFLGRYDLQVSVLPEFEHRELFGWITPGVKKFSVKNVVFSKLFGRRKRFAFDTAVHGGRRAIVPIGAYQQVMPLDILPDFLLKALSIGDLELSESLGCLELTEEDVALLTYVCPGKADYGVMLRQVLDELAKEI